MIGGRRPRGSAGLRALVTRPRHRAGPLAARLRARGIGCLVEPMLEAAPPPWDATAALRGHGEWQQEDQGDRGQHCEASATGSSMRQVRGLLLLAPSAARPAAQTA